MQLCFRFGSTSGFLFPLSCRFCLICRFLIALCFHSCPTFGCLFPLCSHSGANFWVFVPTLFPLWFFFWVLAPTLFPFWSYFCVFLVLGSSSLCSLCSHWDKKLKAGPECEQSEGPEGDQTWDQNRNKVGTRT